MWNRPAGAPQRRHVTRAALAAPALLLSWLVAPGATAPAAADTVVARIDFGPASAETTAGWTNDDGAAFTTARGRGWVRADSTAVPRAPLDLTRNVRDRDRAGIDPLLDSVIHLQYGDVSPPTNGEPATGAWEYALPQGVYRVAVAVGDSSRNSVHAVRAEGQQVVAGFVPTATQEYLVSSAQVTVTDGRLTLDPAGGTNTKLGYVAIDRVEAPPFALKVNFSDQATAPPAGYVRDHGEAYGARGGSLSYGWLGLDGSTPLSLVGNGRNRGGTGDARLATFVHAQLPPTSSGGVATPGRWEVAVPNGAYRVTVSVGDAGTAVDSEHWLSIEDQNAVAAFVPTAGAKHASATRVVSVRDGRLTLTPRSGANTKVNYVDIASDAAASSGPVVSTSAPPNLATGVSVTASVVMGLERSSGVDPATLSPSSVRLTRVPQGTAVAAEVTTSGGSDTINVRPSAPLAYGARYRVDVTSAVRATNGAAFAPHSIVVSTQGGSTETNAFPFTRQAVASGALFTTVVTGPDGRLYAGTLDGFVHRWRIAADGTLADHLVIGSVREHHGGARTVIGMAFDPAAPPSAPALWVTDNVQYVGQAVADWTGVIGRLSGPDLSDYAPRVTGLPRSIKDHETNSLAFRDGLLYATQGSNSAMGGYDGAWKREENLLSAAVLVVDPARLPATAPLDVRTAAGGSYDPWPATAPVRLHATGIRNAYDLVWHSNGHLYVPTNGSAAGGHAPSTPADLGSVPACRRRIDADRSGDYTGPQVQDPPTRILDQTDYVFDVKPGRYYGHPNPTRCEWVLSAGNPTAGNDGPFETSAYPVGTQPDRNLDLAGMYDATLHASANGAIEYRGGAFGGTLRGRLMVVRYSSGQDVMVFDVAANGTLSNRRTEERSLGGFDQPLDIAEDTATGNLYVTELGGQRITLLRPAG